MGAKEVFGVDEVTDDKNVWKAFIAEFIGTLTLVFVGTATTEIIAFRYDLARITKIAFAFGFAVAAVMKAIYHISGGHLNPAVTVAFIISGHIKILKAIIYILCQFIGAICASLILMIISPYFNNYTWINPEQLGVTFVSPRTSNGMALLLETILTFEVVLLFQALFDPNRTDIKGSKPLALGIAIVGVHMAGVPLTGCSINPARSLGPAVVANLYHNLWVYFVGPFLGAILAAVFYRFVLKQPPVEEA